MKFKITNQVSILTITNKQLNQLVELRHKRGDIMATPTTIVASLIDRELRKENNK